MLRLLSHTFLHTEELCDLNRSKFISHVTPQVIKMWKLFLMEFTYTTLQWTAYFLFKAVMFDFYY